MTDQSKHASLSDTDASGEWTNLFLWRIRLLLGHSDSRGFKE